MIEVTATGTPYEIGFKHGSEARDLVHGSLRFYERKFARSAKLDWAGVRATAELFRPHIARNWPAYLEEMRGVAAGAGADALDIVALNVRTEIAFGRFDDGCTAFSWLTGRSSFLAQNWDWEPEQKNNFVLLTVAQQGKPTIKMVTEAGIIGKIGLNSAGVGVCLNAIKAKGFDVHRVPLHLGLRLALEAPSRADAVAALREAGVSSAAHILVADAEGATGLEWSHRDVKVLEMDGRGQVLHTNHYLAEHPGIEDAWHTFAGDSTFRINRLKQLLRDAGDTPDLGKVQTVLADKENYPAAICSGPENNGIATLFSIAMDLKTPTAEVTLGMPAHPERRYTLAF